MNEVPNQYYHDLETVFLDFIYICCICAGPHGLLQDDQSIFDTYIGLWYGKKGQSSKQLGRDKRDDLVSPTAFEERIIPAFHPYFRPLVKYIEELRQIAIPPLRALQDYHRMMKTRIDKRNNKQADIKEVTKVDKQEDLPFWLRDMKNRDSKEFFIQYKSILKRALNDDNLDPLDKAYQTKDVNAPSTQHLNQPQTLVASPLYMSQQLPVSGGIAGRVAESNAQPQTSPPSSLSCKRKADSSGYYSENQSGIDESDSNAGNPPSPLQKKDGSSGGSLPFRPYICRSGKLGKTQGDEGGDNAPNSSGSRSKKRRLE